MIKPFKLNPGDTVATISLSWGGPGAIPQRYEAGKRQLEEAFGVKVIESRYALSDPDWLRKNPEARADDLMEMLAHPDVKAIFSTVGGDDSIRTLRYLDLNVMRDNPKVFLGFSDNTTTHFALHRAGVGSFYGPSIMSGFAESGGLFLYMENAIRRTLFAEEAIGVVPPNIEGWATEERFWEGSDTHAGRRPVNSNTGWTWLQGEGIAKGRLLGGCLEVMDWMRGTDWWPSDEAWQDAILFLEISAESASPAYVSHFLRALAAMGVLEKVTAILFGQPNGQMPLSRFAEYDDAFRYILTEECGRPSLPIITNMDFGHTSPVIVLPYGVMAEVDCNAREFRIVESALRQAYV